MTYSGVTAASAWTKIATLSGASASYDFTAIPATYTDLFVDLYLLGTSGNANDTVNMQFNGDTATNYSYLRQQLAATTTTVAVASSGAAANMPCGIISGQASGRYGTSRMRIVRYRETGTARTVLGDGLYLAATIGSTLKFLYNGAWLNTTTAINRVTVTPAAGSFSAGSSAVLYGIS